MCPKKEWVLFVDLRFVRTIFRHHFKPPIIFRKCSPQAYHWPVANSDLFNIGI